MPQETGTEVLERIQGLEDPSKPPTTEDIQAAREYASEQAAAFERLRRSQWGWTYWDSGNGFNGDHDEIHLAFCHSGREASGTFPTYSLPVGTFPDAVVSIYPDYNNLPNPFSAMLWEFPCRFSPDSKIRDIDLYKFFGYADNQRPWVSPLRDFADDLLALKSLARGEVVNLRNAAYSQWLTLYTNQYPDPMLTGEEMMAIGLELQAAGVNLNGSWMTPFVDFSEWMTDVEFVAAYPNMFTLCEYIEGTGFEPSPTGTEPCYHDGGAWRSILGSNLADALQVPPPFLSFPNMYFLNAFSLFPHTTVSGSIEIIFRNNGDVVFKLAQ